MYFLVRFTGHIDESRRPAGFPYQIHADFTWKVESILELRHNMNEMSQVFIKQQCMIVPLNADEVVDVPMPRTDSRIIVPLHMLTHISTTTKKIVGDIPSVNEEGQPELSDGTKVWKQ